MGKLQPHSNGIKKVIFCRSFQAQSNGICLMCTGITEKKLRNIEIFAWEHYRCELLSNFVGGIDITTFNGLKHNCDICTLQCECQMPCPLVEQSQEYLQGGEENEGVELEAVRIVTQVEKNLLRVSLSNLRDEMLYVTREHCDKNSGIDMVSDH